MKKLLHYYQKKKLDDCFDYNYHIQHVDMIFERLGLN